MTLGFRVGIGHDTHRLAPGGPIKIGGVSIEFDKHLVGHSDADLLLHAVTDALLGATGSGDIGTWFPDNADENQGRDSAEMLTKVVEHIHSLHFSVVNLDCIVFAQQPKLLPYRDQISTTVANLLKIDPSLVNVKAKTGEKVGPVGRGEAMESQAIVLLSKSE